MTPAPAAPGIDTGSILCLFLVLAAPLALAGLALINCGLGRSRNAAHSLMASLCAISVAVTVYCICGFAWQGYGHSGLTALIGGKMWSWVATERFFLRGVTLDGSRASLSILLQMITVGLAGLIPLGAGAERWRLRSICASTALLAGCTYPLFAHWIWGGGWLAQLGGNYGMGRGYADPGGAGPIHAVGGFTALAMTWILGPRRGKYSHDGMPAAIPGHNGAFVLFGCLLALPGWIGIHCAGGILYGGAEPGQVVQIAINTLLAGATSALAAAAITGARFGRPDASLTANGWVGGLVGISAACAFVTPAAAILIGLCSGTLVVFAIEVLELRLSIDDPGGAISVHGLSGIWGILAAGMFGRFPGVQGQFGAQMLGVATVLGFVLPVSYLLNAVLNRIAPQRLAPEGERQGLDLHELGAGAYPEFATHGDEFSPR